MMAISREVERDWAEFEGYATNLYARSIVMRQPVSKIGSEQPSTSDNTQNQSNTSSSDVQSMTDEMTSVRKALLDLRTYSEEVRLHGNNRMTIMFYSMFIDESINAMDDGCYGTSENVERTKT